MKDGEGKGGELLTSSMSEKERKTPIVSGRVGRRWRLSDGRHASRETDGEELRVKEGARLKRKERVQE